MITNPERTRLDVCPDPDTLVAFNTGRLGDEDTERLAGHLDACARCSSAIRELVLAPPDPFEARLRRMCPDPDATATADPVLDGMQAAALALAAPADARATPTFPVQGSRADGLGTVGAYRLTAWIGGGGMGDVFRAEHLAMGREVALKIPRGVADVRPEARARFRHEARAIARFDHPNVVRVHEFDDTGDRPYLVMELVEGKPLSAALRDGGPMEVKAAARLVRDIAAAVGHMHDKKIFHRDLKPSNVLLTPDGTPKVADFGLAHLRDGTRLTASDACLGTPNYMPPEQAAGRVNDIDERSDVYSLGAILYQTLTGVPPFEGGSHQETVQRVLRGDLVRPSRHRPDIPEDLEQICLKCLEFRKDDRYSSAHALSQELGRWLVGERPVGRRPGPLRRAWRAVRRRAPLALAAILLIAGVIWAVAAVLSPTIPDGELPAARRELEAELDKGRPVTLVGETGWPKWFRWLAGSNRSQVSLESDDTFSVHTQGVALLELLPDPRTDRYQFAAQVRHDRSNNPAYVGLYVSHRSFPRTPRDVHFFVRFTFNSVRGIAPGALPPKVAEKVRLDGTTAVELAPELHTEEGVQPTASAGMPGAPGNVRIKTLGEGNGRWFDLTVAVTPDGVTATIDGQEKVLTAERMKESINIGTDALRQHRPDDAVVQKLRPEFTPKGGLGLIVARGSASVRRVVVAPLPPQKK